MGGRHGGVGSTLSEFRRKIARGKGVATSEISTRAALARAKIRLNTGIGKKAARPGFETIVRKGDPIEKSIRQMRHWDSKHGTMREDRRQKNGQRRPRQDSGAWDGNQY